jgi:hypothetical protein
MFFKNVVESCSRCVGRVTLTGPRTSTTWRRPLADRIPLRIVSAESNDRE